MGSKCKDLPEVSPLGAWGILSPLCLFSPLVGLNPSASHFFFCLEYLLTIPVTLHMPKHWRRLGLE